LPSNDYLQVRLASVLIACQCLKWSTLSVVIWVELYAVFLDNLAVDTSCGDNILKADILVC
jgi:hypothetical protein